MSIKLKPVEKTDIRTNQFAIRGDGIACQGADPETKVQAEEEKRKIELIQFLENNWKTFELVYYFLEPMECDTEGYYEKVKEYEILVEKQLTDLLRDNLFEIDFEKKQPSTKKCL